MLFDDEKSCISVLKDLGYTIIAPIKDGTSDYKDITKYFYSLSNARYGVNLHEFNWRLEYMYTRTFIKQLSINGNVKDKAAIRQAKVIIDSVFDNIDEYERYFKIVSIRIFIHKSTVWVIKKVDQQLKMEKDLLQGWDEKTWRSYSVAYDHYLNKHEVDPKLLRKIIGDD